LSEISSTLEPEEAEGAQVTFKHAREGAWALMQVVLPNVTHEITTRKHKTTVAERIISLHAIDGTCSNQTYFGAIDFFCTNGQIAGTYERLKRKNSKLFSLESFVKDLSNGRAAFELHMEALAQWASLDLSSYLSIIPSVLEAMMSKRAAEQMFKLFLSEGDVRGHNMFALYSAMTNYASYADERNGFQMRERKGSDLSQKEQVILWKRQQEVVDWTSSDAWEHLIAQATSPKAITPIPMPVQ